MWPTHYIPFQEPVPGEPPPRYFYTTPPYPYEWEDALESAGLFADGGFYPAISTEGDELESVGSFVGGVLNEVLTAIEGPTDELEATASFVSGALNEIYRFVAGPTDELESVGSFVGGSVVDVPFVSYDNWPLAVNQEDLISTGSFVSGALT